jgi:hypothetical protein
VVHERDPASSCQFGGWGVGLAGVGVGIEVGIDFPTFVADLIHGTFQAIVDAYGVAKVFPQNP